MLPASKSLRGTTLLCVLLSLALLGASVATASTGASSSGQCACSDVRPRSGGVDFELGPTCAEIRAKGDCNAGYLQKTIAEMNGAPYCQITCGQCKCCQPLDAELKSLGLSALADALSAADPKLAAALKDPATEVTLLAPACFKAGMPLDAASARRHVIPAMNGTGALWTRDLLLAAPGGQVESAEKGAPLLVKGATLSVGGGGKAATIVDGQSNVEACKSLIHVIE